MAILDRIGDAGELRPHDVQAGLDRQTRHYSEAWALALHVLSTTGRALSAGSQKAWTFLLRTPEMVEDGVRAILEGALGKARVQKRGIQLAGSSMTFNPDLLFDQGLAVADVKYKLSKGDWDRQDLNQAIAFAEAFGASEAGILRFRESRTPKMVDAVVGRKRVSELTWVVDADASPEMAAEAFIANTTAWLEDVEARTPPLVGS
jgi:McrBC 5-methylcytosine restriction system component